MKKSYKILYQAGEGEIVEKKIPIYRHDPAGGLRGGGAVLYR